MVTTKRSESTKSSYFEHSQASVDLLERETSNSYNEFTNETHVQDENIEQARERMQRNLAALLNYDKVDEKEDNQVQSAKAENAISEHESVLETRNEMQEDDIRPTLTTMQFGDGDIDEMRAEMKTETIAKEKYQLSAKGKIAVVLYSLVVTVILTLIVLNTGVLAKLRGNYADKSVILDNTIEQYVSLQTNIEHVSSNEYIIDTAVNQLGMISK